MVSRHLGVAVATLRSWNHRYGLGPSGHQAGKHRRYCAHDVAALELMCRLVARGITPRSAAAFVRQNHPATDESIPEMPASDEGLESASVAERVSAPHKAAGLVAAALRLDSDAIAAAVAIDIGELGVVTTWEQVCLPAITEIGTRTRPDGECMDAEFVLSWTLTAAMHRIRPRHAQPGARAALLACAEHEWHTLGLDALRATLAEEGNPVRMLGGSTPTEAISRAAQRTAPGAVVIWSQTARTARRAVLSSVATGQPSSVLIAAGPGWRDQRLPSAVLRAESLRTATLLVLGATRGPRTEHRHRVLGET